MPLGTRLRSAWLALFASPAYAAVMQPHPPVAEGAWLRPQHIRSALSQRVAGGAAHVDACAPFGFGFAESSLRFAPAHFRLRRIPAGRRVRMRRGLPSPGSVGIPPVAGSAASRLPPSASPAVTASASCRRPSSPLRFSVARMIMRVKITRRVCRAGSGGGLPVFRDARNEPRQNGALTRAWRMKGGIPKTGNRAATGSTRDVLWRSTTPTRGG